MIKRREFMMGLGAASTFPLVARAQQRRRVIGVLSYAKMAAQELSAFERGLADAGFTVGDNLSIEYRSADSNSARLPALAADLVQRHVDVIFAVSSIGPALAAKAATATIPIVFYYGGDPLEDGLVSSLSRPRGNVTGLTSLQTEIASKRLGLLHELAPAAKMVGFLKGSNQAAKTVDLPIRLYPAAKTIELARRSKPGAKKVDLPEGSDQLAPDKGVLTGAQTLGLNLIVIQTHSDSDFGPAFQKFALYQAGALVVDNNAFVTNYVDEIIALAERHKIPTVYPGIGFVRRGGLMGYGTDAVAHYRLAATQYVAPILKGDKPANLPVWQPVKFELAINLKTAKSLGVTVPVTLQTIADIIIE